MPYYKLIRGVLFHFLQTNFSFLHPIKGSLLLITLVQWIRMSPSSLCTTSSTCTAQKMKFSSKDFFSKCDQIRSFLRIWSHLLNKSLMENFIFCAMMYTVHCTMAYLWMLWFMILPRESICSLTRDNSWQKSWGQGGVLLGNCLTDLSLILQLLSR